MDSASSSQSVPNVIGVPTHGGKYTLYNIANVMFEVPAKYVPPISLVGCGSFGFVASFVHSETREKFAIKKIPDCFENFGCAKQILREIKLLRHIHHENVIGLKDVICPPRREDWKDIYLVYELMNSDLRTLITSGKDITEDDHINFMYQLLRGLKYIHSANVLHRDLAASNLLVNTRTELKIGDFGLARTQSETGFMTRDVVTPVYKAPELLLNCSNYTAAIDIWSVGCIFMELLNRKTLFPPLPPTIPMSHLHVITFLIGSPDDSDLGFLKNEGAKRFLRRIKKYEKEPLRRKYPTLNVSAIDLIEKMLVFDPDKRITAEQALNHPYFVKVHNLDDEPVCASVAPSDFEDPSLTIEDIKDLIMTEALAFSPSPNMMQ